MTHKQEREIRIAYATRQFEVFKMRAAKAIAEGNIEAANNFIQLMTETNDLIDNYMRLNAEE